jgi:hypothetical protein
MNRALIKLAVKLWVIFVAYHLLSDWYFYVPPKKSDKQTFQEAMTVASQAAKVVAVKQTLHLLEKQSNAIETTRKNRDARVQQQ